MDLSKARALFDLLAAERGCLLYSGVFGDSVSVNLIAIAEGLCAAAGRDRSHRQRLAFVMVEAYQNVVRHRARLNDGSVQGDERSLFMLLMHPESEEVVTINPVTPGEEEALEILLGQIGKSDLAQLKALFLARLRDGGRTLRGGAGLGLIEMARKSANGLEHAWLHSPGEHRSLMLRMRIGSGLQPAATSEAAKLQAIVSELDVILACRCGSSAEALQSVLRILEGEADGQGKLIRAMLAAAAWLRVNGLDEEAILVVARLNKAPSILLGIRLAGEQAAQVIDRVRGIATMIPSQRDAAFKRAMMLGDDESKRIVDLLELVHLSSDAAKVETRLAPNGQLIIAVPLAASVR